MYEKFAENRIKITILALQISKKALLGTVDLKINVQSSPALKSF